MKRKIIPTQENYPDLRFYFKVIAADVTTKCNKPTDILIDTGNLKFYFILYLVTYLLVVDWNLVFLNSILAFQNFLLTNS